jgi:hypothetical protein
MTTRARVPRGFFARAAAALVVTTGAVALPVRAHADPPSEPAPPRVTETSPPPGSQALAAEGFDEFQHGNYPEALALFERAYELHASPRILRAIAKCLFELRRYSEAVIACDRALAADRDALGEGLRSDVSELRARALGFTGMVRVVADPTSAEVLIDGRRVTLGSGNAELRVDLGKHVVEASAPGRVPVRRELLVDAGRQVDLRLELAPSSSDATHASRAGTYAVLGAGGALAAGALVSSTFWFLDRSRAVDTCSEAAARGARCDNGADVATQKDLSLGAVVVSATLLVGTAILFVVVARSSPRTATVARGAPGFSW